MWLYSSSGFSAKQEKITRTDVDMSLILAAVSVTLRVVSAAAERYQHDTVILV